MKILLLLLKTNMYLFKRDKMFVNINPHDKTHCSDNGIVCSSDLGEQICCKRNNTDTCMSRSLFKHNQKPIKDFLKASNRKSYALLNMKHEDEIVRNLSTHVLAGHEIVVKEI